MKIHVSSENPVTPNYEAVKNEPKISQNDSFPEDNVCVVKVTISEEGKNAFKSNAQDSEKTNYESMVENKAELIEQKNAPEIDYSFVIGNKLAEIKERDKGHHSIEDEGAALLEAYASAYDEIIQGYANGTRNNYVHDETTESGYRKMTMEEEISGLDDAYQKYISGFEAIIRQSFDAKKAFDRYIKKLSKLGAHRAEMAIAAQKEFEEMSREGIPENIAGRMSGAKKKFIELYSLYDRRGLGIRSLLGNIKIFS